MSTLSNITLKDFLTLLIQPKAYYQFLRFINHKRRLKKFVKMELKKNDQGVEFHYKNKKIHLAGKDAPYLAIEVFRHECYSLLNCKDKIVVDIGACIGDSAIYFSLNGAKQVFALEPFPLNFKWMKYNIECNDIKGIEPLNLGCGRDVGVINIYENFESSELSSLSNHQSGAEVKIVNLEWICKHLLKGEKAVLKLDCEGWENSILGHVDNSILHHFDEIILEYHYGYKNLIWKLQSAGFKTTRISKTHLFFNQEVKDSLMLHGLIHAKNLFPLTHNVFMRSQ